MVVTFFFDAEAQRRNEERREKNRPEGLFLPVLVLPAAIPTFGSRRAASQHKKKDSAQRLRQISSAELDLNLR